jgi:hypothetical protein
VFRVAYSVLHHCEDAEDIAQDSMDAPPPPSLGQNNGNTALAPKGELRTKRNGSGASRPGKAPTPLYRRAGHLRRQVGGRIALYLTKALTS